MLKVLLIVTAVVWKTSCLWGLLEVIFKQGIARLKHYAAARFPFLIKKQLLIDELCCEGVTEEKLWQYFKNVFELAEKRPCL